MSEVGEGTSAGLPVPKESWWRRWRSLVIGIAIILAAAILLHLVTGTSSLYALLLAPLGLLRNVVWRVGLNRVLTIALLALVPIVLRRRGRIALRRFWHRLRARLAVARDAFLRAWNAAPVWLRTFLGSLALIFVVAFSLLSGVVLWLIALLPFVAKTAVGVWLIRYLAHFAAGRGVRGLAPMLWRFIPARPRLWVERRYRHLWWWTMRRIVRNRHRVVRRMWRRKPRQPALPGPVANTSDKAAA